MNERYVKLAAYAIYKEYWIRTHISFEQQAKAVEEFYSMCDEDDTVENRYYDVADYIDENGYGGTGYVCFEEFLDNEYQDREFMKSILPKGLYEEYEKLK